MMQKARPQLSKVGAFLRTKQGIAIVVCSLILLLVSCYSATKASHTYATNSDAIVDVFMFGDGLQRNQIVLPGQHANTLKFPLFIFQGMIPFTFTTFMLVNIVLILATIGLWTLLLTKLFGRKYLPLILLAFAALVFSSTEFSINLAETTIRNVEFPLALWFVFIINDVLRQKKFTTVGKWAAIAGCVLYSILLSGDSLFIYATSVPILIVLGVYWLQTRRLTRPMIKAGAIVAAVSVGAFAIKLFLNVSGLVITSKSAFSPTVVDAAAFFPSIVTAGSQVLKMQGAYIFGETIGPKTLALFINFALLFISFGGLMLMLAKANKRYRGEKSLTDDNTFIYATVGLSFLLTLGVYIFSGQVVQQLPGGQFADMGQIRYIAFLPLLLLVGFVWVIKEYYSKHRWLMVLLLVMFVVQIISVAPQIRTTYAANIASQRPSPDYLRVQTAYLKQQDVHHVITGYWDGSPLRFWSNSEIKFAPIAGCKFPFDINTRIDWYIPEENTKSALLVDRTGPDAPFWNCDDATLVQIYGEPASKQTFDFTEIWVYNTDVRSSLPAYDR